MKENFLKALKKLRSKAEKRGFDQTVDLIINLTDLDLRKNPVNAFFSMPNVLKEPKICAFLEKRSPAVDRSITKSEMGSLDKKEVKNLGKDYDFFIASAPLMGPIATVFGKTLGPLGKMPNPKAGGVLMTEDEESIKKTVDKFKKLVNVKPKDLSVKLAIGKESTEDGKLAENAEAAYNGIIASLPRNKENVKSIMIKLTMSKPEKLEM